MHPDGISYFDHLQSCFEQIPCMVHVSVPQYKLDKRPAFTFMESITSL